VGKLGTVQPFSFPIDLLHKALLNELIQQGACSLPVPTNTYGHFGSTYLPLPPDPIEKLPLGIGQRKEISEMASHGIPRAFVAHDQWSGDSKADSLLRGIQKVQRQATPLRVQLWKPIRQLSTT
jgi:hypothetical protein